LKAGIEDRAKPRVARKPFGGALSLGCLLQFIEMGARFVLPLSSSQSGSHHADQRGGMKRALQECNIAERRGGALGCGISLDPAAAFGQQHERKVRPWRLRGYPGGQRVKVDAVDRFFGNQRDPGPASDLAQHVGEILANVCRHPGFQQHVTRNQRIATARSQDERTLGMVAHTQRSCSISGSCFPT
jgi:hypothetical protein